MLGQLRKTFPAVVTTEVLQKLGIAPNNESYVINILRFLELVDKDGKKVPENTKFFLDGDPDFAEGLAVCVKSAYQGLFDLHNDVAWTLDKARLISYFRKSDESTELVGSRQANTFIALAQLAGKRVPDNGSTGSQKSTSRPAARRPIANSKAADIKTSPSPHPVPAKSHGAIGLNVRIELNLPTTDDPKVYDALFKSIRENLLNGA